MRIHFGESDPVDEKGRNSHENASENEENIVKLHLYSARIYSAWCVRLIL